MKKRRTLNLLFYIKKSKCLRNGESPIYLRITVDKQQAELAMNKSIMQNEWCSEKCLAKGNSQNTNLINNHIEKIKYSILEIYQDLYKDNKEITANIIKNIYQGKTSNDKFLLVPCPINLVFDFGNFI